MAISESTITDILAAAVPGTIIIIVPASGDNLEEETAESDSESKTLDTSILDTLSTSFFMGGLRPTEPSLLLPTGNPVILP